MGTQCVLFYIVDIDFEVFVVEIYFCLLLSTYEDMNKVSFLSETDRAKKMKS